MGYTTHFSGAFQLSPNLNADQVEYITKFNSFSPLHGVQNIEEDIKIRVGLSENSQFENTHTANPSSVCQWIPSRNGKELYFDGDEKFYFYVEWLHYLINQVFNRWEIKVNGKVDWQGEEDGDRGTITITDSVVVVSKSMDQDDLNWLHGQLPSQVPNDQFIRFGRSL